jgi:hypothetical protein
MQREVSRQPAATLAVMASRSRKARTGASPRAVEPRVFRTALRDVGSLAGARERVGLVDVGRFRRDPQTRCAIASDSVIYDERVARAPPAAGVLAQRATLDEIQDVAVCSVLRALGQLGPLDVVSFRCVSLRIP